MNFNFEFLLVIGSTMIGLGALITTIYFIFKRDKFTVSNGVYTAPVDGCYKVEMKKCDLTPKESTEYSESLCNKTGLNYEIEKIQLVEYDLCRGVELFNHATVRFLVDKMHRLNRDNKILESDNSRLAILAFGNKKTLEEYQEELANIKNNKPHPWI